MTDSSNVHDVDTKRASSRVDRDRMLEAMHALEGATARPATPHMEAWTHGVQEPRSTVSRRRSPNRMRATTIRPA